MYKKMKKISAIFFLILIFFAGLNFTQNQNDPKNEYIQQVKKRIEEIKIKASSVKNPVNEYLQIARLYAEIEEDDNAIFYLEKVILIDRKNANAYHLLALIYERKKDYSRAIYFWERCLENTKNKNLIQTAEKHIKYLKEMK